jgi:hypothetical protein
VRSQLDVGGFTLVPGVGFSLGRVAAQNQNGTDANATLSGVHATLAIRIR